MQGRRLTMFWDTLVFQWRMRKHRGVPSLSAIQSDPKRIRGYVVSRIAGNCRNSRILFSTWTGESGAPGISEAFR